MNDNVPFDYYWAWGPGWTQTGYRALDRKGARLRVLARGKRNSAMIEFEDGYRAIVSRNGIRRIKRGEDRR